MTQEALAVRGGPGGVAVNLAELGALAALLHDVDHAFREAEEALGAAAAGVAAAVGLPVSAAGQASAAVGSAKGAAARCAAEAEELATGVAEARERYRGAESATLTWLAEAFLPDGPGDVLRRVFPWPFPGPETHAALVPLGWALTGAPTSRPLVEMAQVGEADQRTAPLTGAGSLLAAIDALYPAAGGEPGTFEVLRVERADGDRSWVVLIPGTQTMSPGGAHPMDNATNLQEFVGAPSAMATAVLGALSAAGVGRREQVLLAGHSQGGIVAARLAADAEVRRRFRVTSVVTAGSPVGHVPLPEGVNALHLEHTRDLVPTLDDAANPDHVDRVTVRRDGGSGGPGSAHTASSYARTAELVDASSHPSLSAWQERAREVLGDGSAKTTRTVYQVRRR